MFLESLLIVIEVELSICFWFGQEGTEASCTHYSHTSSAGAVHTVISSKWNRGSIGHQNWHAGTALWHFYFG